MQGDDKGIKNINNHCIKIKAQRITEVFKAAWCSEPFSFSLKSLSLCFLCFVDRVTIFFIFFSYLSSSFAICC